MLDAPAVHRWCAAGRTALLASRDELDGINVFPVADGDTGTNLLLTLESVCTALEALGEADRDDPGAVATALTQGSLLGARGSSGVLLSQLLRGLAESLGAGPADPSAVAAGLAAGARLARTAVAEPVEGTLLTVAEAAAAEALRAAAGGAGLGATVAAARRSAATALAGTPAQLAVLARRGVVDAGGSGWLLLLGALHDVVTGRSAAVLPLPGATPPRRLLVAPRETGSDAFAYEVQYLLREADDTAVDALRAELAGLGDSLAVVGADGLFNVHVHVNDVGAAVEAGLAAGRPSRISVMRFADQPSPALEPASAPAAGPPAVRDRADGPQPDRATLALVAGDGLAALLRAGGAEVLAAGPPPPSGADVLRAAAATGARHVLVLTCDEASRLVAQDAADRSAPGLELAVLPTASPVQALAALAVRDAARTAPQERAAMAEAAAATRTGEVVVAVSQAQTSAGPCLPGDALGLVGGRVAVVGAELGRVARELVDRLVAGAELLTLVVGRDAPPGLGAALREHVRARFPQVDAVVLEGGQPGALLVGAE